MPANLKIFLFFILSANITIAQIVPSFQGVYNNKSSSTFTSGYVLGFNGNEGGSSGSCSYYGEVSWPSNIGCKTTSPSGASNGLTMTAGSTL